MKNVYCVYIYLHVSEFLAHTHTQRERERDRPLKLLSLQSGFEFACCLDLGILSNSPLS